MNFGFVPGGENPADIVSRGATSTALFQSELWWNGPCWLKSDELPDIAEIGATSQTCDRDHELDGEDLGESHLVANDVAEPTVNPQRYSSLSKLVRVNGWVKRFISALKGSQTGNGKILNAQELANSRMEILRQCQEREFATEIKAIKHGKQHDRVSSLGLFLDNGLIRCKGRIEYSDLPYESKFPILLPSNGYLTELVVMEHHRNLKHSGASHTLADIRKVYWVPKGQSTVKRILNKCLTCRRHEGQPFATPKAPPLPKERVTQLRAFQAVGLDYFGPMYVKGNTENEKVWACLFTCLTTRAVHLELLSNMTCEEFLMAFRRFNSRRGTPSFLLSDNAKQFKSAKNVLDLAWMEVQTTDDVMQFVSDNGIEWKFITELAPWMGGTYERMVGLTKRALRKFIGVAQLSFVQLQTLLTEIEAVINSRPLMYVGEEFSLSHVLTPAHLLTGNLCTSQPVLVHTDDPDYFKSRTNAEHLTELWQKQQRNLDHFWRVWSTEYLLSLRDRERKHKNTDCKIKPAVNSVVIVKDDLPRGCWKIAIIEKLHESNDGRVRSATLRLPSGRRLHRPVKSLCPLECSADNGSEVVNTDAAQGDSDQRSEPTKRPKRNAAAIANLRNTDLVDDGHV